MYRGSLFSIFYNASLP